MNPPNIGDRVICRMWDATLEKFYGESFEAKIIGFDDGVKRKVPGELMYVVLRKGHITPLELHRNEILGKVKHLSAFNQLARKAAKT